MVASAVHDLPLLQLLVLFSVVTACSYFVVAGFSCQFVLLLLLVAVVVMMLFLFMLLCVVVGSIGAASTGAGDGGI